MSDNLVTSLAGRHWLPPAVTLCVTGLVMTVLALTAPEALSASLPDGRVYEQVSEEQKNGNEAGIVLNGASPGAAYAHTTADGRRMAYQQVGPSGETLSGTDLYSIATRDPQKAWSSRAALPPGYGPNASNFEGEEPKEFVPSSDLSTFVFSAGWSFQRENPTTGESSGLYRAGAADPLNPPEAEWWLTRPTFASFSEATPQPGAIQNSKAVPVGGTPDLSRVYFTWNAVLSPEDKERAAHVTAPGGDPIGPHQLYEWHEGTLKVAGELPDQTFSPWGAVPAATGTLGEVRPSPFSLRNEVSQDGSKAFFVSPEPSFATQAGTPTELYLREQTPSGPRTVLVSRNELNGGKAAEGAGSSTAVTPVAVSPSYQPYVYASPDGARAFFESKDKLANGASGEAPQGSGPWMYEFNTSTEKVTYLPGVAGNILASSQDGSRVMFARTEDVSVEREFQEEEEPPEHSVETFTLPVSLETWSADTGTVQTVATWPVPPTVVAENHQQAEEKLRITFGGAYAARSGAVFVFDTGALLKGSTQEFNNSPAHDEVYRYEPGAIEPLSCISCAPTGSASTGAYGLGANRNSRTIADEGRRVFFSTAAKLVPQDINGVEDVYEWEQEETGSCPAATPRGCTYLVSSGTSPDASFYLDNDESGENVFFSTRQGLVRGDSDESYDVYDARVNGGFTTPSATECAADCSAGSTSFSPPSLPSSAIGPAGNLEPATAPPPPGATPKPRVLRHSIKGHRAILLIQAPAAGMLTLSGPDLHSVSAAAKRPGTVNLKVTLTKAGVAALKRHRGELTLRLRLSFRAGGGATSLTSTTLVFR